MFFKDVLYFIHFSQQSIGFIQLHHKKNPSKSQDAATVIHLSSRKEIIGDARYQFRCFSSWMNEVAHGPLVINEFLWLTFCVF